MSQRAEPRFEPHSEPAQGRFLQGFEVDYDWERESAYPLAEFFSLLDQTVERYFYGFYHPLGRRLIEGSFSPDELRFLALQEWPYYASTTWWNAGKLAQSDTLGQQRELHDALLDELGTDLVEQPGLPAHAELFLRYAEGLGLGREEIRSAPLAPAVVLAVTELRRVSASRPAFEFLAMSNLVVEKMRPRHYARLLDTFQSHYTWVPKPALLFYEVHAHLDSGHESLGRRIVAQYVHAKREQDAVFASVLRSLCLRLAMYDGIDQALRAPGGAGLVAWPNFPREPWPRPLSDGGMP